MFNNSMLGEVLNLISRREVKQLVGQYESDRYRKSFKTCDHLVTMVVGQLSGLNSLRELEFTLNSHPALHYHLGISAVKRSTLSDANNKRGFEVFRDIALNLIAKLGKPKDSLEKIVTILDSSLILLGSRGHGWAKGTRDHSAGLKLHVQYNHDADSIEYVALDDANSCDLTFARKLALEANRIYVFDKGYCDYNWWKSIADTGSTFVTRLKKKAAYKVLEEVPVPEEDRGLILKNQLITLSNTYPRGGKQNTLAGIHLRLIEIQHPSGQEKPFTIVTNAVDASIHSIALWYKDRWSIELLFKWLKQNLRIKRFLGESRNAIMIQIFVAIIAYALLKLYRTMAHVLTIRLKDLLLLVRTNLFTRPKLYHRRVRKRQPIYFQPPLPLSFAA